MLPRDRVRLLYPTSANEDIDEKFLTGVADSTTSTLTSCNISSGCVTVSCEGFVDASNDLVYSTGLGNVLLVEMSTKVLHLTLRVPLAFMEIDLSYIKLAFFGGAWQGPDNPAFRKKEIHH